jgi:MYXO-CTERM domain-containing protein
VNNTHTCVECTPTSNTCDPGGVGGACLSNGNCGCITDSDCGAIDSGRVCDNSVSRCTTGCRGTGGNGCPSGLVCTSTDATIGTCRLPDLCQTNADCTDPTPICDTTSIPKHCVGCVGDSDCTAQAPVCENNTCVGCTSDADCTDPALPACQTAAGDLQGQCTECSAANDSLCGVDVTNGPQNANEPECLTALGTCGCTDTDGDSECGNATSGRICNGPVGVCTDGCSTAQGRNDCPTTKFCSDQTGAVGTCQTHCNTDADCTTAPELVCNTTPVPHVCVECTEQNKTNCSMDASGDECLSDNTCGCNDDADCGATDSGRICGTDNKCTEGCRGTGGNQCPDGEVCTSSTSAPGTCQPEQDAGVDAGPEDAGPPTSDNSIEGGGCACSVPSSGSSSPAWAGWAALLAAAVLRGRRPVRPKAGGRTPDRRSRPRP